MEQTSLVERVGDRLRAEGAMVGVAESSTGGLLSSLLTDVAGASGYFERGVVTYSNAAKMDLLGVEQATLEENGAVSAPTARQMACGVRELAGTEWGVSTTGIAGPGGGTSRTPVGTVYIGIARACADEETPVAVERYEFEGQRRECKEQFARQALSDLLDAFEEAKR
jgi:nicotinamide-nucleotide amidase